MEVEFGTRKYNPEFGIWPEAFLFHELGSLMRLMEYGGSDGNHYILHPRAVCDRVDELIVYIPNTFSVGPLKVA